MNMIMPSHHQARFYAEEHGNDAVEYRADSSEPWAVCSPICAWNPAPFEYRKAAGRWTIDAETVLGVVVRRTFSQEKIWVEAIKEYTGHKVTLTGRYYAAVQRMKIAKWKDVPRLTRVTRIDGDQFEFLGVSGDRAVLLRDFNVSTLPFSDIKLALDQPDMLTPYGQPGFINRLGDAGFSVSYTHHTFRILELREGWEMEA
jgi:hypothetical protein